MIQKKRINNDVFVRWGVFTPEGLPVDLTKVTSITVEARPQASNGRYPMVSEVVDNFVEAYFLAKDQKVVGKYNLYLTYTIDDPNIIGGVATYTIDYCDAFELLPKSCFVDGEDDVDPVNIQGIIASFTYSMLTEEEKNDLASRISGNSGAQNLSDLLDVTISNLEIDQILKYDGTKWVNVAPTGGSSSNVSWGIPTSQYTPLTVNGVTRNLSLNNHTHSWDTITNRLLTDEQFQDLLEIAGLWKLDKDGNLYTERNVYSHGEVSAYNWGDSPAPPVGVYNLKDLLDVGIINPQEDNILRFNGSHWVNVPSSNVGTLVEWSSETDNYVNLSVGDSSKSISLHGHKHEIGDINNLQDSLDFKQDNIPLGDISQYYRGDKEWATLNTDIVVESTNLYYTPERVIELTGGLYAQKDHTHAFNSLTGLPNTLDGYGIIDAYSKTEIDNLLSSTSGFWVKSVGLEAPTGFTVSNSPIIYEGNIKLSFASGYSLPSNSKQYNWDLAFADRHTHTNINVLNELTIDDVNNWNSIQEHLNDHNNPHQVSFKQLINKPSTLLGYGITDVYSKTEVDYIFNNITPGESTIKNVYGYDSIDQSFSNATLTDTFNAYTISRLHDRLTILEQGDTNLDAIINWYNNIGKYWLLDADNDALYTTKNVYSTKGVSALGFGESGGGSGGAGALSELVDTSVDSRMPGDILVYNGTHWENRPQSSIVTPSLELGETSSTAYRGDRGKIAYDHSQVTGNPHNTTFAQLGSKPTTLSGFGITDAVTSTVFNNHKNNINDEKHLTQAQLINLINLSNWWKFDEENDAIYSEKSVYSLKGVSALGFSDGGGSGGGDFDRLDAWADYDSTKSGWVLSALLGVDLNNRLSNVEGGSATSVDVIGTGDVIVGGSKSGKVITLTRGNQSWDNLSGKPATFTPASHTHSTSDITSGVFNIARIPTGTSGTTVALGNHLHTGLYEPVFTKNTAFNKNFGTTSGTVAQGNDSRIINGQTAYSWGNHASAGYALNSALTAHTGNTTVHITSTERTNWNDANSKKHTHGNKSVIDALTQGHIDVLNFLSVVDGNIKVDTTLWATGGISALGLGDGGGSGGGDIDMLDSWANYTEAKANYYVPASLLVTFRSDTSSRLTSLENGSATSIDTTGSGNAITSVSKSGNTLTFAKGSTFSLSTHNHDTVYKPIGYVPSWSEITGKPSTFAPSSHTHTIANVTGLQNVLDGKQATLIQGSNITITGNTISAVDTTYGVATTSANGLMSSADKSKLNGIESNANNYSLPTASATVLGGIKVGSRLSISSGVLSANVQSDNNFTNAYKTKLDGIEAGANNYVHPSSHPISFITGLQSALDGKSNIDHTHSYLPLSREYVDRRTITPTSIPVRSIQFGFTSFNINNTSPYADFMDLGGYSDSSGGKKNLILFKKSDFGIRQYQGTFGAASYSGYVDYFHTGNLTSLSQLTDNIGVATHIANTSNPHSVTKAQVGLGNVDNTADSAKNVLSATKLTTARTINGTSFNGSASITTANWGTARNIGIVNSDGTGTAVTTSVNGSANVNLKLPSTIKASLTGNASSATKLQTARTIAGVLFDGSANIAIPFANLSSKPTTLAGYGITDGALKSLTLTAGNGLTGGGTLEANRTFALGTPSTLTAASTNAVTSTSHTHAITTTTVGAANTIVATDASGGVRGNIIRIGANWTLELSGTELWFKYGGVVKQKMFQDGSFVATGEVAAYSQGVAADELQLNKLTLLQGGGDSKYLTSSATQIYFSIGGVTPLVMSKTEVRRGNTNNNVNLGTSAYPWANIYGVNLIASTNISTPKITLGNGWTIEQTAESLTIRRNGIIKWTFNA